LFFFFFYFPPFLSLPFPHSSAAPAPVAMLRRQRYGLKANSPLRSGEEEAEAPSFLFSSPLFPFPFSPRYSIRRLLSRGVRRIDVVVRTRTLVLLFLSLPPFYSFDVFLSFPARIADGRVFSEWQSGRWRKGAGGEGGAFYLPLLPFLSPPPPPPPPSFSFARALLLYASFLFLPARRTLAHYLVKVHERSSRTAAIKDKLNYSKLPVSPSFPLFPPPPCVMLRRYCDQPTIALA